MQAQIPIYLAGALSISMLVLLWVLIRHMQRRNRAIPFAPTLLEGRAYRCPACGRDMQSGWVMLGKGAIWSPLRAGPPGALAHIGSALPNTISLSLRPASNLSWHCPDCQMLLVDHSTLVTPAK
ncbi:PF20097 family protein [Thiocystis violacea]|uniref:PF20097 family protein n=1 Tax=Thiocystis violacea TaxID=13725 RepID=UPI001902DB59|nr:PF20097 family protein [Thiocystis violacea]MBK1720937.1 hypothetical protein [Thiocystis violacea]